jgi:hypothetical protein
VTVRQLAAGSDEEQPLGPGAIVVTGTGMGASIYASGSAQKADARTAERG